MKGRAGDLRNVKGFPRTAEKVSATVYSLLRWWMEQALEGGVNESMDLDSHGKSWSYLLLALPIELEG